MKRIHTVAVVGAGTMGQGIAQVCAVAGFSTCLFDIKREQVFAALDTIRQNLQQAGAKGKLTQTQVEGALLRITPVFELTDLRADLIIEAAVENLKIKQELFKALEKINGENTILATNTSSISVTRISDGLKDPFRCIGFHFFNPADRMRLVEIISGEETDPSLVEVLKEFSGLIEKIPVLAKDSPGFIVNRVARHFYVESLKLLEENAASVSGIDALMRSAGFKMGPFELMDLIGLDTNLAVTQSVYAGFNQDPRFKPSRIQQELVDKGNVGRKKGKGFYDYSSK